MTENFFNSSIFYLLALDGNTVKNTLTVEDYYTLRFYNLSSPTRASNDSVSLLESINNYITIEAINLLDLTLSHNKVVEVLQ